MSPTKKPGETVASRPNADGTAMPATLTEVGGSLEPNVAAEVLEPEPYEPPRPKRSMGRRILSLSILGVGLLAGVLLALHVATVNKQQAALNANQTDKSSLLKPQSIPLNNLGLQPISTLSQTPNTLTVNGQLNVADSIDLSPIAKPQSATAGQLFYDQTKHQLGYFNGGSFVYLQGGGASVTNNITNVYNTTTNNVTNNSGTTGITAINGTKGSLAMFDGAGGLTESLITQSGSSLTTGAGVEHVTVGSTSGASTTIVQGGSGNVAINTGGVAGTSGTISIESGASSTTAAGNVSVDTGSSVINGTVVENDTFETGIDDYGDAFGHTDILSTTTAESHSGSQSLQITEGPFWGYWAIGVGAPYQSYVTPGHTYRFSAWVRAATVARSITFNVDFSSDGYAGGGTVEVENWGTVTDSTTGWTQVSGNLVAPVGAYTIGIGAMSNGSAGTQGEVHYLDDVTVTDLNQLTATAVLNLGATNAQQVNLGNANQTGATSIYGTGLNLNAGLGFISESGGFFGLSGAQGGDITTTTGALTLSSGLSANWGIGGSSFGGGSLTLHAGQAGGDNNGGDLILQSGIGAGTGVNGDVRIDTSAGGGTGGEIVLGDDSTPYPLTVRGAVVNGNDVSGSNITFDASNGTGAGGSGSFAFRTAKPSGTVIGVDNTAHMSVGSTNTATLSFTTGAQSDRMLVVTVITSGATYTSITYDGIPLTQLATEVNGALDVEMWYLANPPTGTFNIITTKTNSNGNLIGATDFYNVNQANPFGTFATNSGTTAGSGSTGLNVATTSADQLVVDGIGTDGSDPSSNAGQTQLWNQPPNAGNWPAAAAYKQGTGGVVNMGWTVNSSDWADIGVPLNPTPNTNADTLSDSLVIANSGNVGIDNASPQYTLDVAGDARFQNSADSTTAFQIENTGGNSLLTADTLDMKLIAQSAVSSGNQLLTLEANTGSTGNLLQFRNASGNGIASVSWSGNFYTAGSLDTNSVTPLLLATSNASAVTIGHATTNIATTINGTLLVKPTPSNDSTTLVQVQAAGGAPLFTVDSKNSIVTVANFVASGTLTVDGHIITGGSAPSITAGAAACTSPMTVNVSGNDSSGTITIKTGTACVSGTIATIGFMSAYGNPPHVVLTPGGLNAASLNAYVDDSSVSDTGFALGTGSVPTATTTYQWNYFVVQ